MAISTTTEKKSDDKALATLKKMMKLLDGRGLGKVDKVSQETKKQAYVEKNKNALKELAKNRYPLIRVLASEASLIVTECATISTMYEDFRKQSAGMTDKQFTAQRDQFLAAIKQRRDALKSFVDRVKEVYNNIIKFKTKVEKNYKELKEEPQDFEKKLGFPVTDAKKVISMLQLVSKGLIKIGVQIRQAETQLEFR